MHEDDCVALIIETVVSGLLLFLIGLDIVADYRQSKYLQDFQVEAVQRGYADFTVTPEGETFRWKKRK